MILLSEDQMTSCLKSGDTTILIVMKQGNIRLYLSRLKFHLQSHHQCSILVFCSVKKKTGTITTETTYTSKKQMYTTLKITPLFIK